MHATQSSRPIPYSKPDSGTTRGLGAVSSPPVDTPMRFPRRSATRIGHRAPWNPALLAFRAILIPLITTGCDRPADPRTATDAEVAPALRAGGEIGTPVLIDTLGDTASWGLPLRIEVAGPYLVVVDDYANPQVLVADRRTGTIVNRFGRKGQGPHEIDHVDHIFATSPADSSVWIYDERNQRLTLWSVAPRQSSAPRRSLRFRSEGVGHRPYFTDRGAIMTRDFGASVLYLGDSTGVIRREVGTPPFPPSDYLYDAELNFTFLVADPARHHFAVIYRRADRVAIYRADGSLQAEVVGPRTAGPRLVTEDGIRRYARPFPLSYGQGGATERFLYLPYCGCTTADARRYDTVHVLSWDGELVSSLEFPTGIWALAPAEDDQELFVAIHEPYPLVLRYRLPAPTGLTPTGDPR
jgi:hypothetical protein